MIAKEFEEISHTGGKVTFSDGHTKYEHCNPHNIIMYEIAISLNGIFLGRASLNNNAPCKLPLPYFVVMMASDKEGFFGYLCNECKKYFRGKMLGESIFCPYCLHIANEIDFLTSNQLAYIGLYVSKLFEHHATGEKIVLDLDEIVSNLDQNIIKLNAYEERQQQVIICEKCKAKFDVIGVYVSCPRCAFRNNSSNFFKNMKEKFSQIDLLGQDLNGILNRVVEDYAGVGSDIKNVLERIVPLTGLNKKKAKKIDFQKIITTSKFLFEVYGLKLFSDTDEHEGNKEFLSLMLQKRHIIAHNSSVVDQKYLDETKDSSVRLGQVIKVEAQELKKFINLLQKETKSFFEQFETLFMDWLVKNYKQALEHWK